MPYQKDENEIGALWEKTSANGAEYLSGEIDGQRVVCFRVRKPTAKGPAWRVLKSQSREQAPSRRYEGTDSDDIGF